MFDPLAEMQKFCCSTEDLNTQEVFTLEDVLHNDGAASVLVHNLELEDKRSLRLVCHAGKDAVDSTVTYVYMTGMVSKDKCGINYACILSNANWKDIKKIRYLPRQKLYSVDSDEDWQWYVEPQGLTVIGEAGLSKIESLSLHFFGEDIEGADALVKAGWKLKKLELVDWFNIPSEWFGTLMRDANWPLEELRIYECTESIASIISVSEWKLKELSLPCSHNHLSSEGVETLMEGSWVSTVEWLSLSFRSDGESKGVQAISLASYRALNLVNLGVMTIGCDNKDALILGEGSYPNLKRLNTNFLIHASGIAAILRKCPKLEKFEHSTVILDYPDLYRVDDPEDAKLVAEQYKNGLICIYGSYDNCLYQFKAQLADYL